MTRRLLLICLLSLALLSAVTAQDKTWKATLEHALQQEYPLTKMDNSLFSGRTSVKDTGVILTVQQAGMPFTDGQGLLARIARVRNGKLTSSLARSGPGNYIGKVGDKVYVRDINISDDEVELKLLTVDPIEQVLKGTTTQRRYYGLVRFEFDKTWLPTATAVDVMKAIGALLATEAQATAAKTIELDQTIAQVETILGKPSTVVKLGAKTIYTYKDMKVIFTNGKVSDVQ